MLAMDYEWDPDKARSNLDKHDVDFADAATAQEVKCHERGI
jgi:uncharacterized DUF497 family protein